MSNCDDTRNPKHDAPSGSVDPEEAEPEYSRERFMAIVDRLLDALRESMSDLVDNYYTSLFQNLEKVQPMERAEELLRAMGDIISDTPNIKMPEVASHLGLEALKGHEECIFGTSHNLIVPIMAISLLTTVIAENPWTSMAAKIVFKEVAERSSEESLIDSVMSMVKEHSK